MASLSSLARCPHTPPALRLNKALPSPRLAPSPLPRRASGSCSATSRRESRSSRENPVPAGSGDLSEEGAVGSGVRTFLAAAAAAAVVVAAGAGEVALAAGEWRTYYGTAASASSYGGYGGNASKEDTAEYVYDVPAEWKERAISKVEKGTNGTDSEFYNPKKRSEKTYLTYLAGFRRLPPKDNVLSNIALSDVDLQDLLASADSTEFKERTEGNQLYYDFEIDSSMGHVLISVTAAKNKLYSHFVNADPNTWSKEEAVLRQIHDSFKTVGRDPLTVSSF